MYKKVLSVAVFFMVIAVSLTATQGVFADAVKLKYWIAASPEETKAVQAQVDAFQKANPDITVEVTAPPEYDTQLQQAFASNDYPDVFYVGQSKLAEYAKAGVLAVPSKDNLTNVEGLYPSLHDTFVYNGKFYCPAKDFSVLALEYNKDAFDKAGVAYPTDKWTWDDLLNATKKLSSKDMAGLIFNADLDRWYSLYVQAGGKLYDDKGNFTLDKDAATAAFKFFQDLHTAGAKSSTDVGAGWPGEAFGQKKGAMTLEGNWIISYMLNNFPDIKWGAAPLPMGKQKGTLTFTVCLAVGANTKHATEAWKLVNFLTSDAGAKMVAETGFGPMPSRSSGADLFNNSWEKRSDKTGFDWKTVGAYPTSGSFAVAPITPAGYQLYRDELNKTLQALLDGKKTPDAAYTDISKVITELAAEKK